MPEKLEIAKAINIMWPGAFPPWDGKPVVLKWPFPEAMEARRKAARSLEVKAGATKRQKERKLAKAKESCGERCAKHWKTPKWKPCYERCMVRETAQ